MKMLDSLIIVGSVCTAFSFAAYGSTQNTAQQNGSQAKPVQLAMWCDRYGRCYHRYRHYHYYPRCYRHCWTGYWGHVHCKVRCYRW